MHHQPATITPASAVAALATPTTYILPTGLADRLTDVAIEMFDARGCSRDVPDYSPERLARSLASAILEQLPKFGRVWDYELWEKITHVPDTDDHLRVPVGIDPADIITEINAYAGIYLHNDDTIMTLHGEHFPPDND